MRSLILISGLALLAGPSTFAADKPNILVISIDDMGWGQPSCYGGDLVATPHIDSLAADGVRFTDAYAASCVCSPSRVGLVTGRYPARTGHDALTIPPRPQSKLLLSEVTMAQRMKAEGYHTGIVGKWHLGATPDYLPAARGFDYSFGSTTNVTEEKNGVRYFNNGELIPDPVDDFNTIPVYREKALEFMEENQDKPWFLYFSPNNVHGPTVASEPYYERFRDMKPKHKMMYAANIAEADDVIGSLLEKLKALDLESRTLVIFFSDNGNSHPSGDVGDLRGGKWEMWEGGIRAPFIVRWKGRLREGLVLEEPIIQLDVLPTAIAAAGGEIKPEWGLDGVNLLPLMDGKDSELASRTLYWRFGPQYAIRQGKWKITKASVDMSPVLIDLSEDPGEATDLSARYPERMSELQKNWDGWNASMEPPRWEDNRWDGIEAKKRRKAEREARSKKTKS